MFAAERNGYKPTLIEDICRWAYSFVLVFVIPFAFLQLMLRGATRNKNYNRRRFERFGFVSHAPKENGYLFHCVSVGEVVAASCLIKRIMQDEPECQITVTTTTPTGSARVRAIFGDTVHHFYLPYDLHMAMAVMLKRIKPKAVLITEVELWPNLIHACWKRDIPVMVVNARMTDRSARRYKKISKLFNPMLGKLYHICAQGERDFANYAWLGVSEQKLTLTNNIKFDQVVSTVAAGHPFLGLSKEEYPILVAGSTHDTEETAVLNAAKLLWRKNPSLKVIIVPRHPERFDSVAKLIEATGLPFVRSSQEQSVPENTNVILLDEMGKLNDAYAVGAFAFVGGSIADKGGHNALEPASFSIPIMMGPNTYNNPVICSHLEECGALVKIDSGEEMFTIVDKWICEPNERKKAGQAGRKVLEDNSGALESTVQCIRKYVN
ncbi:3-deoxy-D-manno-octulosonic-acid transferase [Alteromonas mediterranea MED64]|uniref:3-deoxy-D-manno-octulosonic acid transferase n=1 Tax=Alteromonas mediterranea TaxID=314275 RepID=UPI00035549B8|nr:3-deoxy-D-manno-octulosonic acid transferase [Alteromonas mediterranea]AGP80394.1 3-deoxy-D-manno-octulosonic-acid transferase [Alteromonas mediterranea MED64]